MSAAVLFDMDGVLVVSEELKDRAHAATVQHFGATVDPRFYRTVMGRPQGCVEEAFMRVAGLQVEPTAYSRRFREIYEGLLRTDLKLAPGATELIAALHDQSYRLALVSSSLRWMIDEVLTQTGLGGAFEAVVSADDVENEKPSPAPYLLALARLSLEAHRAVVLEDTEAGVEAGCSAGCAVVALRHEYNTHHDLSKAIVVLDSLVDCEAVIGSITSALGDPAH